MIRLLRRRIPAGPARTDRDAPIPLTSATDGRTHLISAANLDRTIAEHGSTFRTLCGRTVLAASLAAPPGPRCPGCHSASTAPNHAPLGHAPTNPDGPEPHAGIVL
ncbi:MAG: hypothetical protein ACRDRH_09720 [Pseudonocardia sp.]